MKPHLVLHEDKIHDIQKSKCLFHVPQPALSRLPRKVSSAASAPKEIKVAKVSTRKVSTAASAPKENKVAKVPTIPELKKKTFLCQPGLNLKDYLTFTDEQSGVKFTLAAFTVFIVPTVSVGSETYTYYVSVPSSEAEDALSQKLSVVGIGEKCKGRDSS